jgi:hypothetical protein
MPLRGEQGKIIVPFRPWNPPRSPRATRLGELMLAACGPKPFIGRRSGLAGLSAVVPPDEGG